MAVNSELMQVATYLSSHVVATNHLFAITQITAVLAVNTRCCPYRLLASNHRTLATDRRVPTTISWSLLAIRV